MRKEQLVQSPSEVRPHVVLLGAGASRAAFPNGDGSGHQLPLMNDLVDVVGLRPVMEETDFMVDGEDGFEKIYSRMVSNSKHNSLSKEIEHRVREYFSFLCIPTSTTIYDYLLLSLRRKDAIFTFNWDPFLFDAYTRNRFIASLPEIFFLHGNVRIGTCLNHPEKWGERHLQCPVCLKPFGDVPLLYPIEQKDYSSHPYIRGSWEAARYFFSEAFVLTIFGYSAPASDVDAVVLLKEAWMDRSDRKIEHIEVIDLKSHNFLYERWKPFLPTGHLKTRCNLDESWITMYPRRSVEALRQPVYFGRPSEQFSLTGSDVLHEVQGQIFDIASWEQDGDADGE